MILSIANISPKHGMDYYTKEGHSLNLSDCSNWHGKLAQTLKLSETVEAHPLACLLQGRSPTGETLIDKSRFHSQRTDDPAKERAGVDLTTSAPKSISIQVLVFDDRSLELAHQTATARMLDVLEERYSITRQMQNGRRQKVVTGQCAIAQFHHDTSREFDPQLHTHNVILNLQRLSNGKWLSLDNTAIYQAKMLLGQIYRNELALEVQRLGYEIQVTNYHLGLWELKGYSNQQLRAFSKRSQQIQEHAGENASSEHKAWIAISSGRKEKQQITRQELEALWKQESAALGLHPAFAQTPREPNKPELAHAIARAAIDCLAECSTVFRRAEIEQIALTQIGQFSFAALQTAIDQHPNLTFHLDEQGQQVCTYQNAEVAYDSTTHDLWGFAQQDCTDSTTRLCSDRSEPAEALHDFRALEQFRQDLRALAASCPSSSTERNRLAGVEPFDSSHRRTTGTPTTMAETASSYADPTEAIAGKPAAIDQPCEYGGQQSDIAISGGIDYTNRDGELPGQKTEETELELDRTQ